MLKANHGPVVVKFPNRSLCIEYNIAFPGQPQSRWIQNYEVLPAHLVIRGELCYLCLNRSALQSPQIPKLEIEQSSKYLSILPSWQLEIDLRIYSYRRCRNFYHRNRILFSNDVILLNKIVFFTIVSRNHSTTTNNLKQIVLHFAEVFLLFSYKRYKTSFVVGFLDATSSPYSSWCSSLNGITRLLDILQRFLGLQLI